MPDQPKRVGCMLPDETLNVHSESETCEVCSPTVRAAPKCYSCIHRRNVPGDAHSSCQHPTVAGDLIDQMVHMLSPSPNAIKVTANRHGIDKGWFMWPANFDPVWLETCTGFTPEEK